MPRMRAQNACPESVPQTRSQKYPNPLSIPARPRLATCIQPPPQPEAEGAVTCFAPSGNSALVFESSLPQLSGRRRARNGQSTGRQLRSISALFHRTFWQPLFLKSDIPSIADTPDRVIDNQLGSVRCCRPPLAILGSTAAPTAIAQLHQANTPLWSTATGRKKASIPAGLVALSTL